MAAKDQEENFCDEGNILHLDHNSGYITEHIYPNSPHITLKKLNFIVYKLFLNKSALKIIKYRFLFVTQLKLSQIR